MMTIDALRRRWGRLGGGFRTRIAVSFLTLLIGVLLAVLLAVHAANTRSAREHIERQLLVTGRVFDRLIATRDRQLAEAAHGLAGDAAFRGAIGVSDEAALRAAMQSHVRRMKADLMLLASPDGELLGDTARRRARGTPFPFPHLIDLAQKAGEAPAFVATDEGFYQAVVVPVRARVPVAWVLIGLRVDDAFAADFQTLTSSEISFVQRTPGGGVEVLASTLPPLLRPRLAEALAREPWTLARARPLELLDSEHVTLLAQAGAGPGPEPAVVAVLQRPLREATQPFRRLQDLLLLLFLFLAGLAVAVAVGFRIARSVSRPLLVLADGARKIEHGDYAHRVDVRQRDEFGELAAAFNNMARGISEREDLLRHQAYHDALTGLPNRSLFHHLLQQALAAAARDGGRLGVLLLDLDRFKEVNDTLGHNTGDLILQQAGPRLRSAVREADTVARLGGDECAVLLRGLTGPGDAAEVAERIRAALEEAFVVEDQPIELSASVGIAIYPEHGADGVTLIRRADVAMYAAKRAASGVAFYEAGMDPNSPQRLRLVGALRHAIDHDTLVLHYQPKVELASGRVTDAEALVRQRHPEHGLIPPADFVPLAEQTGLIGRLTVAVLGAALRQWTEWRAQGLELGVAVNVSARVLQDERFPDRVRELLERWRVPAVALMLEITESAIMADPACAVRIVGRLHALGVRLSIDDFGTGYSSLSYLKNLRVDELKIDRSFVRDLVGTSNEVIARSTIDLAHKLNIRVTAEGVDAPEVWEVLARHGCDEAQGYLISPPLAPPELARWLRSRRRRAPDATVPTPAPSPA